jgi:hypothetical protein
MRRTGLSGSALKCWLAVFGRNVDDVARFPLEALLFLLRRPVIGVGDLDVVVDVHVVAAALDDVDALLGELAMAAGLAARAG